MDKQRMRELKRAYQESHPRKGVFSISCANTGERFFGTANDLDRAFNRHRFQLEMDGHPNKRLQALWNEHGEAAISYETVAELDYEDAAADHADDLAELLEIALTEYPEARKL